MHPIYACLYIPDFAAAALQRGERRLPRPPLVVFTGKAPNSVVHAASAAARAGGIRTGMTLAEARMRFAAHPKPSPAPESPILRVQEREEAAEAQARRETLEMALTVSPHRAVQPGLPADPTGLRTRMRPPANWPTEPIAWDCPATSPSPSTVLPPSAPRARKAASRIFSPARRSPFCTCYRWNFFPWKKTSGRLFPAGGWRRWALLRRCRKKRWLTASAPPPRAGSAWRMARTILSFSLIRRPRSLKSPLTLIGRWPISNRLLLPSPVC